MARARFEAMDLLPPDRVRRFHAQMFYSTESTRASALKFRLRPDVPRLTRRLPHLARGLVALMTVRASACEGLELAVGNPCTMCNHTFAGSPPRARDLPLADHTLLTCTALEGARDKHIRRVLELPALQAVVTPLNAAVAKTQDDPDKRVTAYWPNKLSLLLGGEPLVVARYDEQLGRPATARDVEGWLAVRIECIDRLGNGQVEARHAEPDNKPWIPDTVTRTIEQFKGFLFRQTASFLEETMKSQAAVRRRDVPLARPRAGWRYTHARTRRNDGDAAENADAPAPASRAPPA